jgi:hypothetical protein
VTIRATIQTDGPFISLAFEVRPPGPGGDIQSEPRQSFGPLRLATVDDAVVLLSQFARYLDDPASDLKEALGDDLGGESGRDSS